MAMQFSRDEIIDMIDRAVNNIKDTPKKYNNGNGDKINERDYLNGYDDLNCELIEILDFEISEFDKLINGG